MIRKTPRSGWTAKHYIITAALSVAVVFVLGVALSPPRSPTVAVIGDRADEVHLPDIAELCWDACHDRIAPQITLTRMRFGKTRKVVVFHLPDFDDDIACVATRAANEMQGLRAALPACHIKDPRLSVWILPMGLGRIS